MASNILSKLIPPVAGSPSVYETLRQYDESSDQSDLEERAGMALDEENLGSGFQDYELDDALADATASHMDSSTRLTKMKRKSRRTSKRLSSDHGLRSQSPKLVETDDLDDEVPQSLLIEDDEDVVPAPERHHHRTTRPPVSGPIIKGARAKWKTTQEQQRLHQDVNPQVIQHVGRRGHVFGMIDPKEKALWRWANVENLDNFLKDVYDYFLGNGIWCILLSRALNLL